MIGLDTNILLRWLLLPHEGDLRSSNLEIEKIASVIRTKGARFFVNVVVLAEVTWILEQKLKLTKPAVTEVIDRLCYATNIEVGNDGMVRHALTAYSISNAGFADCLIAAANLFAGCSHTLTFDRKASKTPGFLHIDKA